MLPVARFVVKCSFALAVATAATAAEPVDVNRFERSLVAGSLKQPMEIDVAPDGRIFLIELAGLVKTIDPATGRGEVVGELEVTTAQENGLIGLALDPGFATNGWVYLQYSPPDYPGQRISRFTFRNNRIDRSSERVLLSYEEQRRECCHHAGSMEFGPDGCLYIGTGDNTNPFNDSQGYAPLDERPGREPWDAQRSAGNTRSYNGKILRIRPEADGTSSIPEGNLFPRDGSRGLPEIYVMGCRNPWRISIDAKTGYLFWGDVGPDAGQDSQRGPRGYDEINRAREAGNYGWPYFIGDNFAYADVDFAAGEIGPRFDPNSPVNASPNNTGSRELPPAQAAMVYYPGAVTEQFSALGSGGRTACAGPVYHFDKSLQASGKFPEQYDGTLFAFEWSRSAIYAVHLDEESNLRGIERFLPETEFSRPIDMVFDHAGSLYVLEYGETWGVNPDARLVRIDYERGNRAPVAVAAAENSVGREPLTVRLSAVGSTDKDGDPLSYRWTAVGGADPLERRSLASTQQAEVVFEQPGVYTVELEAVDPAGRIGRTSLPVIVGNAVPTVRFTTPTDGDFYRPGEPVAFSLVIDDPEDGTSDFDRADDEGLEPIDATAPNRTFVEAVKVVASEADAAKADPPGLAMIRKSDCLNCHAIARPLVGPSFLDVANKYRGLSGQVDLSVARVLQGSTGVWGKVAMLPHSQHTPEQVRQMVEYVFAVTADAANPTVGGLRGRLPAADTPRMRLEAVYTDLGRKSIPALSGVGAVTLRNRLVEAESADEFRGTRKLGSGNASGKYFMGAIEHDGFLKFASVPLGQVGKVVVRVASAGSGGEIEVRRGSPEGQLLGKQAIEVNGEWESFYALPLELPASEGRDDLYLVFKNEKRRGGLMNVDSIEFVEP